MGTTGAGVTIFLDFGLAPQATYTYQVRATNRAGDSAPSNPATVTLPPAPLTPPAAPGGLQVTGVSATALQLDWQDAASDETGFRIQRRLPGGEFAEVGTEPANATRHLDGGLRPGTTYEYRVCAYNDAGPSDWSNVASGRTPGDAPKAPEGLFANPVTPREVRLTWSDRSDNEEGFRIERRVGATAFAPIGSVPANTTVYSDLAVAPRTTYVYRVVAYNSAGDSRPSNEATATTAVDVGGVLEVASEVRFGSVRRGTTARKTLTLRNASADQVLRVTLAPPASPFGIEGARPVELAPGARARVTLTFRPTRRGSFSGTLRITSTDPARPRVTVRLTGTGG